MTETPLEPERAETSPSQQAPNAEAEPAPATKLRRPLRWLVPLAVGLALGVGATLGITALAGRQPSIDDTWNQCNLEGASSAARTDTMLVIRLDSTGGMDAFMCVADASGMSWDDQLGVGVFSDKGVDGVWLWGDWAAGLNASDNYVTFVRS